MPLRTCLCPLQFTGCIPLFEKQRLLSRLSSTNSVYRLPSPASPFIRAIQDTGFPWSSRIFQPCSFPLLSPSSRSGMR